ncbi:MAG: alpha/beta hydrolase, partial [Oxalobacteraceae bacterium]
AQIRCPTLLGVGRQDVWSPLAQHQQMAQQIPHARLVVFENSGHMAPLEAPAAVSAAMRDWLQDA